MFGGNIKKMMTGTAPLSAKVQGFYQKLLDIPIHQNYGQTEASGPLTFTYATDKECGFVGGPSPHMKIRLRDVPELGYLVTDNPPRGEV